MKGKQVEDILAALSNAGEVIGERSGKYFSNALPIEKATIDSFVWISPTRADKQKLVEETLAVIIICDSSIIISNDLKSRKCFIIVENPKLSFLRAVNQIFPPRKLEGIHPTAFIESNAKVHPSAYIGPFTYISNGSIGAGTIIHGQCYLYDNVTIGNNVIVHAGTIIGADGFGYSKNENGELEKFPHIGGVVIEDDVEIGSNTCIDRGSLGDTIIKAGAKIDNLVHVAHNVVIGKNALVIANAMIGGSTRIGDNSWISPSAILRDGISIGNNATVGMGALVTKDIPDNETWAGNPAKPLSEFLELQKKLKNLE